jgi:uncharacterized alkaline shock family protein YloU
VEVSFTDKSDVRSKKSIGKMLATLVAYDHINAVYTFRKKACKNKILRNHDSSKGISLTKGIVQSCTLDVLIPSNHTEKIANHLAAVKTITNCGSC